MSELVIKKVTDLESASYYTSMYPGLPFVVISKGGMIVALTTTRKEAKSVVEGYYDLTDLAKD